MQLTWFHPPTPRLSKHPGLLLRLEGPTTSKHQIQWWGRPEAALGAKQDQPWAVDQAAMAPKIRTLSIRLGGPNPPQTTRGL